MSDTFLLGAVAAPSGRPRPQKFARNKRGGRGLCRFPPGSGGYVAWCLESDRCFGGAFLPMFSHATAPAVGCRTEGDVTEYGMLAFGCMQPIRWSMIALRIREARFRARGSAFSPMLSEAGWLASFSEQWVVSRWAGGWAVAGRARGVAVGPQRVAFFDAGVRAKERSGRRGYQRESELGIVRKNA